MKTVRRRRRRRRLQRGWPSWRLVWVLMLRRQLLATQRQLVQVPVPLQQTLQMSEQPWQQQQRGHPKQRI